MRIGDREDKVTSAVKSTCWYKAVTISTAVKTRKQNTFYFSPGDKKERWQFSANQSSRALPPAQKNGSKVNLILFLFSSCFMCVLIETLQWPIACKL